MRAEREKRANILASEGARDGKINNAEGIKQDMIKQSEAVKQKQINEAEGQAAAILTIAKANADSIRMIAEALGLKGGHEAASLKVAEEYVKQLGAVAQNSNLIVVPANLSEPTSMIASAFSVFDKMKSREQP